MYNILYDPSTYWIGPAIIAVFCILTPLFLYLSYKNKYTKEVVIEGWEPVIAAMGISRFVVDLLLNKKVMLKKDLYINKKYLGIIINKQK